MSRCVSCNNIMSREEMSRKIIETHTVKENGRVLEFYVETDQDETFCSDCLMAYVDGVDFLDTRQHQHEQLTEIPFFVEGSNNY